MGEISVTKLLVIAALIVLLFGTKKLRSLGGDLGAAIKGFKKSMKDDEAQEAQNVDNAAMNDTPGKISANTVAMGNSAMPNAADHHAATASRKD